ncbi:hypothetical protein ISCGN_005459 [Ixodes scapularis]
MQSGKSTYKCSDWVRRRRNSSTVLFNHDDDGREEESASKTEDSPHDAAAGSEAVTERDFVRFVSTISSKLEVLTAEIKCLKVENVFSRSEIGVLNKRVLERQPLALRPHELYSAAAVASSGSSGGHLLPQEVLRPSTLEATSAAPTCSDWADSEFPAIPAQAPGIRLEIRSTAQATGPDGFTLVQRKRRSPASTGTGRPEKGSSAKIFCLESSQTQTPSSLPQG